MSTRNDSNRRVYVVGSVNQDLRVLVDHHVATGQTITGFEGGRELGGKGTNQALAATRAGADVHFIGAVGDDVAGIDFRRRLENEGVNVASLEVRQGRPTGQAIVMVDSDGNNAIVVMAGANGDLDITQVRDALGESRAGDVILTQMEIEPQIVREAARIGRAAGAQVIVNAAPFRGEITDVLPFTDVLIVNEHERDELAQLLQCNNETIVVALSLKRTYGTDLLCTLGAEGSEYVHHEQVTRIRGKEAKVVDTTGAGDTYIGFLVAALSAQMPMMDAMARATVAAGIAVGRWGCPFHPDNGRTQLFRLKRSNVC